MKKKMLVSFMVMAICCALVGGATFAVWTDSGVIANNSVDTATFDLTLGEGTLPLDITDMQPGDGDPDRYAYGATEISKFFTIQNTGEANMLYKVGVKKTAGNTSLASAIKVKVIANPTDFPAAELPAGLTEYGHVTDNILFEGTLTELIAAANADDPRLSNVSYAKDAYVNPGHHGAFSENMYAPYKIQLWMPFAETSHEDQSWKGSIVVTATQEKNQNWDDIKWTN